jgi:hypothetical protein
MPRIVIVTLIYHHRKPIEIKVAEESLQRSLELQFYILSISPLNN